MFQEDMAMVQSGTLEMPAAVYSTVREEYDALTKGIGLVERSHLGRLRVSGADAIDLLDRLSTNKLNDMLVGEVEGTVLTTNKGRIIDLLFVVRRDDHLLVITGPETRQRVAEWIDFYTFIEDVVVEDVSEETAMLSVAGRKVAEALPQLSDLPLSDSARLTVCGIEVLALHTEMAGIVGYDLMVSVEEAAALRDALTDVGAVPVGSHATEILRIGYGVAEYGGELHEDYNPLEAGLKDYISFNKGCYIGQEVVARLNTYDKVQKHLMCLSLEACDALALPTPLTHEGRQVGTLTSTVEAFDGDRAYGLGYIRKAHAQEGTRLFTESGVEVVVEGFPC